MDHNIISQELALIMISSVVLIPSLIALWFFWKEGAKDLKDI